MSTKQPPTSQQKKTCGKERGRARTAANRSAGTGARVPMRRRRRPKHQLPPSCRRRHLEFGTERGRESVKQEFGSGRRSGRGIGEADAEFQPSNEVVHVVLIPTAKLSHPCSGRTGTRADTPRSSTGCGRRLLARGTLEKGRPMQVWQRLCRHSYRSLSLCLPLH